MLDARGLRYIRDGQTILAGVDVTVDPGESLAVTGPSGSGKSSLLAAARGPGRAHRRRGATWTARRSPGSPGPASGVALVLQGYGLVSLLTAAENIEVALRAGDGRRPRPRGGPRRPGPAGPGGARGPAGRGAVRRPAAAGRGGPGAGPEAQAADRGRADRRARPGGPGGGAGPDLRCGHRRRGAGGGHARPGGGRAVRPHPGPARDLTLAAPGGPAPGGVRDEEGRRRTGGARVSIRPAGVSAGRRMMGDMDTAGCHHRGPRRLLRSLPVHRGQAGHAAALGAADVPALVLRPGRGAAAPARRPHGGHLRRGGLGGPGPVLHARAHAGRSRRPLGLELLRDQRAHLRRGPRGTGRASGSCPWTPRASARSRWPGPATSSRTTGPRCGSAGRSLRSPGPAIRRSPTRASAGLPGPRTATSQVRVRIGAPYQPAELGDRDHFLTARWVLFSVLAGRQFFARAEHQPWPLHRARGAHRGRQPDDGGGTARTPRRAPGALLTGGQRPDRAAGAVRRARGDRARGDRARGA